MQIKLKYFDLSPLNGFSGRGGAIRFYMLLHNIRFEEEYVKFDDWGSHVKADVIKSGESPTGHLPIVYIDGQPKIESYAILRKFSKQLGEYGKDEDHDYMVDMVADAVAEFRSAVVQSALGSTEDKTSYLTDKRKQFYTMLNTLINQCNGKGAHVVGDRASFADCVAFAVLWDDVATHGKDPGLWEQNPMLGAFFEAYLKQGPVMTWCKQVRADLLESRSSL